MNQSDTERLLAFDISSTNIGWVLLVGGAVTRAGTISLKGDLDARLRKGSLALYQLLTELVPNRIAFEDAAYRAQPMALIAQARMVGCLYAVITSLNMPCSVVGIAPATAKKALSGSGRADKAQMMAAAAQHADGLGEHEADALGVALAALASAPRQTAKKRRRAA